MCKLSGDAVLAPNLSHLCSVQDVMARYKETGHKNWKDFPSKACFQMNDTHPTIAVAELMRLLIDQEGLDWEEAWSITTQVCLLRHTTRPLRFDVLHVNGRCLFVHVLLTCQRHRLLAADLCVAMQFEHSNTLSDCQVIAQLKHDHFQPVL
jgi:hypothetical protein